jgi:poly-beta-1,6-N-acetyl-D-glucosamine synthase
MTGIRTTPVLARTQVGVSKHRSRTADRQEPTLKKERSIGTILNSREFAKREVLSINQRTMHKRPLALVIAAYNESLVLEHTILSAMAAGLSGRDIYIVDDSSNDGTPRIARSVVGGYNVLTVGRSGKGLAIHTIVQNLKLTNRYDWIHIADADGEFDTKYFVELYKNLNPRYAAATGYVSSLPGSYISQYRAFEYTMGMDVTRRFQSMAEVITIVPGPTSVFRSDVFQKLDFNADALCEDFDVTLQIHRQGLGKIQFIPTAVARTQDPGTFRDFIKQITRWNRGVMQMFFKHRIGKRISRIDAYLVYQMMQNILFFAMNFVWVPIITVLTGSLLYLALAFLSDVVVVLGFVIFAQMRTGRKDILPAFPFVYLLRFVSLGVFLKCFIEVFLFRKYRLAAGVWETVERRVNV